MRVTRAPKSDATPPGPNLVRLPMIGMTLKASEGRALVELLDHDAIVPLRRLMARLIDIADAEIEDSSSPRERVDISRGERRVLRFLDDLLCEAVPEAYRAMVASAAKEAEDGPEGSVRAAGSPGGSEVADAERGPE